MTKVGHSKEAPSLGLASDAVPVAVEMVWVGIGHVPQDAEVAVGDVGAVEVWWRRRDADGGV
jgi:hypothetical protein